MPERTNTLSCPVDFISINEYQVRLIALQVLVAAVVLAVWQPWPLAALLLVDFALRAFDQGKFSPLGWVARQGVRWLSLGHKPVDQAPKRFAARIGLVFSFAILLLIITNNLLLASIVAQHWPSSRGLNPLWDFVPDVMCIVGERKSSTVISKNIRL